MTQVDYLKLVDEVLDLEPGTAKPEDELEGHGWGSMSRIAFVAMMDEHFNVAIASRSVANCSTVQDLIGVIEAHVSTTTVAEAN